MAGRCGGQVSEAGELEEGIIDARKPSTYGNMGNSYLVYGGDENYHREGIGIISWREICQIIDKELE